MSGVSYLAPQVGIVLACVMLAVARTACRPPPRSSPVLNASRVVVPSRPRRRPRSGSTSPTRGSRRNTPQSKFLHWLSQIR